MNAEALIGKVLGTCTLQRLVGQGGMGAVFLAQQSRPRRLVAVKVLLPVTPLNARQFAAFLERFRRETDAAASLEHPNIMPVHEYGEQDSIVYLVMPYIGGGTLRDELERTGPFTLPHTVDYLEQLAAAIDFAHEHGVIHRDIKPANIMVNSEGRLLLADFGLVKIVAEGQTAQVRLTGAGAPIGTPDYMSPEQVIGDQVDTRADLYSLGVILFQMLTGTTPFQGETPMQIAAQHLQIPPPSPQMLRPDLPIAAEQIVLRAMAKRPADRYKDAQEMAKAFRSALVSSGIQLDTEHTWAGLWNGSTASRLPIPKGQFDPLRQTASVPKITQEQLDMQLKTQGNHGAFMQNNREGSSANRAAGQPINNRPRGGGLLSRSAMFVGANPSAPVQNNNNAPPTHPDGSLSRNGNFQGNIPAAGHPPAAPLNAGASISPEAAPGQLARIGKFPMIGANAIAPAPAPNMYTTGQNNNPGIAPDNSNVVNTAYQNQNKSASEWSPTVGAEQNSEQNMALALARTAGTLQPGGTLKLNEPVKVVKVPVGDQPGQYITGILPFEKQADEDEKPAPRRKPLKPWMSIALAVLIVALVLGVLGTFTLVRNRSNQTMSPDAALPATTPGPQAQASATADANVLLSDPLDKEILSWPISPANKYAFKNGAYHIIDTDTHGNGVVLAGRTYDNITYTLTMQEINGDDSNPANTFGMIFRFNQQTQNGKTHTQFYSFEVTNVTGSDANYQLWHYDSDQKNQWIAVKDGKLAVGKEFHQGKAPNTIKIIMQDDTFTVSINGNKLSKTFKDGTIKSGTIGMIVNNQGTEVAFKNLLLTKN